MEVTARPVGRADRRPALLGLDPFTFLGMLLLAGNALGLAWLLSTVPPERPTPDASNTAGTADSDPRPAPRGTAERPANGRSRETVLEIPRLDLRVRVVEGTDDTALAAGVGHWTNDTYPGGRGNYVLAGHRVTHGEPFADLPQLRPGDRVLIHTRAYVFTYRLLTNGSYLRVNDDALWVTSPYPLRRAGVRTDSSYLLTLITCAETFHTDDRYVAFGHLVAVRKVAD